MNYIGKYFGVPVYITDGGFLSLPISAVIGGLLAYGLHPNWSWSQLALAGVLHAMMIFGSVIAHEYGPAFGNWLLNGMPTERIEFNFSGGLALLHVSEQQTAGGNVGKYAFGPLTNIILCTGADIIGFGATFVGIGDDTQLFAFMVIAAAMNFYMALVNFMPMLPLDGGWMMVNLLWMWRQDLGTVYLLMCLFTVIAGIFLCCFTLFVLWLFDFSWLWMIYPVFAGYRSTVNTLRWTTAAFRNAEHNARARRR